jgi:simple sugar transport system permease protein
MPKLDLPVLSDLPLVGQALFGQDPFVYASFALVIGVWWFLSRTRAGLVLRACGENHASAHALGYPVLRIRLLAILFGGGCAGLAGAYLSLAYTPFWSPGMTAGRGWIALAIVVFASWLPWRLLLGAYIFGGITILQLHAQGFGVPVPSQALAALPYVVTIAAMVLIMARRTSGLAAPGSLGAPFVADR